MDALLPDLPYPERATPELRRARSAQDRQRQEIMRRWGEDPQ